MRRTLALAVVALTLAGGCDASTTGRTDQKIVVLAAASLTKSFGEIGDRFKSENPGSHVEFSFAGSSTLATQLTQGAPADVFASADPGNMQKVVRAGLVAGDPVNFASNTLTIVVAPGNPKNVTGFRDLTKAGLAVVVCAAQVPCGSATQKVEQATGVQLAPVSEESSVTDVLSKVLTGQADAGLVYVTDAMAAGDKVTSVPFAESAGAVNVYPIAVLKQSGDQDLARAFVEMVASATGQQILRSAGFARP